MPSEFIMVPRSMVFNQMLPPQVLRTGLMLSYLLEPGSSSLEIELRQLKEITGRSEASLYSHLALLRMMGFLNWAPNGRRGLRLEFSITSAALDDLQAGRLDGALHAAAGGEGVPGGGPGAMPGAGEPVGTLDMAAGGEGPGGAQGSTLDEVQPGGALDPGPAGEMPGAALDAGLELQNSGSGPCPLEGAADPGSPPQPGSAPGGSTTGPPCQASDQQAGGVQNPARARQLAALREAARARQPKEPLLVGDALRGAGLAVSAPVKGGSLRDPAPDFGPNPAPKLGPKLGPKPEPNPALELGPNPGPELGLNFGPNFGPNPAPKLGPEPGPNLEPNPGPEPVLEPGPETRLDPGLEPAPDGSPTRDPPLKNSKLLKLPSFNPPPLINILTIGRLKEGALQNFGVLEPGPAPDPMVIYQELTGLRPSQAQKKALEGAISDLRLWRESVDHWLAHRWSPKNIPGMLNLYNRGGPDHCRYCNPDSESGTQTIYQEVLEQIKHGKR